MRLVSDQQSHGLARQVETTLAGEIRLPIWRDQLAVRDLTIEDDPKLWL
jgi:hypothetical protein